MNPLLVELLISLGGTLASQIPQISSGVKGIIASGVTATDQLINSLAGQHASLTSPTTYLAVLGAAITALWADPKLPKALMDDLAALEKAITDTLAADKQSQAVVDASTIDAAHAVQPLA